MVGDVGNSIPPRGEAGLGYPDTPENRERMQLAAQNLGLTVVSEEFLAQLRAEVIDADQRLTASSTGTDETVSERRSPAIHGPQEVITEE